MKTLIQLCFRVRKFLTQTFKHGIEDQYKKLHGSSCSRSLSYCRDLCFLPHLLKVKTSWKDISVQDFSVAFNIDGSLLMNDDQKILCLPDIQNPLFLSSRFWERCAQLIDHRLSIRQNLFVGIKQVSTWNVGGAAIHRLNMNKLRAFRRLGSQGILCLQETRWSQSGDTSMQQRLNKMQVAHTPAVVTDAGGRSGGVAILFPLGFSMLQHVVILESRIHAVLLQSRTVTFWIVNCYLHPLEKGDSLRALQSWIGSDSCSKYQIIMCGDFNQADVTHKDQWDRIIQSADLHDLTTGVSTYHHQEVHSELDKVLSPLELISSNHLHFTIRTECHWVKAGHDTVKVSFRPRAALEVEPHHSFHLTLPTSVFKLADAHMDYRNQDVNLADLQLMLSRCPHPTFYGLQSIFWKWWHSMDNEDTKPRISSFLLLRKKLERGQALIWATEEQISSFRRHLPGYMALDSGHIPSTNGFCHIPASVLEKAFEIYDLQQAHTQATEINRSVVDKIRGLNSTNVFWQRMRSICPRTIFYPGPIQKSDGSICKTGEDMDEAMLETRQFWFDDPVSDDPQWDYILKCYADATKFWPEVPLPTDSDYTAAVLSSKDSAPGPDGLPYAAWRVDVTQSSEAMVHFMARIQSQCAVPPVSVGVWIPKAKLGPTANHFRPLGMPSTFERLVDCTAAAVLARHVAPHLHPSQTVLNEFREPQQAVMAIQNVLDGSDTALVLSLDLSKAFERINPFWLLKILRLRGAPTWVVRYAQHILFGRSIRHKVRGRLLPPRFVKTGVDMGRAFSVFLFCIGMDPVLTVLNRIPGVITVQGYIDDTTLAGRGHSVGWVDSCWQLLMKLKTAGIQIDSHRCWRAVEVLMHPCKISVMTAALKRDVLDLKGCCTAAIALSQIKLRRYNILLARDEHYVVLTIPQVRQVLLGQTDLVFPLYSSTCGCSTKTMTLSNDKILPRIAVELDMAGVGAHTLVATAPSLGLLLEGKYYICEGKVKEAGATDGLWRNTKATAKIHERMRLFSHPANSVVSKSIAFSMYIFSTTPYFSSYHGYVADDIDKLNSLAQTLILGRAWLRRDYLSHVFRWLRIAPLCDPAVSLTLATVGLYIRKGGCIRALLPSHSESDNRHDSVLSKIWTPWLLMLDVSDLSSAVQQFIRSEGPRHKAIQNLKNGLKRQLLSAIEPYAVSYICSRVEGTGWPGGVSFSWLQALSALPKCFAHGVVRFALLRWALGEDDDLGLAIRIQYGRTLPCCLCGTPARSYPAGLQCEPFCEACIADQGITCFSLSSMHAVNMSPCQHGYSQAVALPWSPVALSGVPRVGGDTQDANFFSSLAPCVACGQGDNSIGHWARWCVVPVVVASVLLGIGDFSSLDQLARRGRRELIVATHIIHQFRRLLLDMGGFQHGEMIQQSTAWWIQSLGSAVSRALHPTVRAVPWPDPTQDASPGNCHEHLDKVLFNSPLPFSVGAVVAPDVGGMARCAVKQGEVLGTVSVGHPSLRYLSSGANETLRMLAPQKPNALLRPCDCSCDIPHVDIVATELIAEGAAVIVSDGTPADVEGFLLQFDGSCRRDENIGGAGYCIFRIKPGELVYVEGGSIALGSCSDNVEAEAEAVVAGFVRLLDIIDETLGAASAWNTPIYVQGDIQPIIRVLAHHGRLRRLDILKILEPVRFGAAHRCRKVRWIFLPREVNIVADHLAGVASRFALSRLQMGRPIQGHVSLKLQPPLEQLLRVGARIRSFSSPSGSPTFIFAEVANCSRELVERYLTQAPQHKTNLLSYLARGGQLEGTRLVSYTPRSLDSQGRIYAVSGGAQLLPKTLRILIYGKGHYEVDMIGAFYEIVRRKLIHADPNAPALPPIAELRKQLRQALESCDRHNDGLVKRITSMAINMSPAAFQLWVASEGLEVTLAPWRWVFDLLQLQAGAVVATTLASLGRGPLGLSEQAFRALECIEFGIMYRFVELLTQHSSLASLIWLHDGVWISPAPDRALLGVIEHTVSVEHSMAVNAPLFRITKLDSLRDSVVRALPRSRTKLPSLSSWSVVLPTQVEAHVARSRPSDGQLMSSIFFKRQLRNDPGFVRHGVEGDDLQ